MIIPILHDGRSIGSLETRREGAYTLFEARCAFIPGVRRLWVYGEGGRGCLGVMQPEDGELRLRTRRSRADMRTFPREFTYAGFAEGRASAPPRGEEKAFIFVDRGVRYLALPCTLNKARPGLRLREIGGRRYLLFRC
ncbi:MAG: hypothetical protein IJP64_00310 [Oscillospiraceae bacterium]|nr:hypothetical protein [Oscillospiraceae bacterium]